MVVLIDDVGPRREARRHHHRPRPLPPPSSDGSKPAGDPHSMEPAMEAVVSDYTPGRWTRLTRTTRAIPRFEHSSDLREDMGSTGTYSTCAPTGRTQAPLRCFGATRGGRYFAVLNPPRRNRFLAAVSFLLPTERRPIHQRSQLVLDDAVRTFRRPLFQVRLHRSQHRIEREPCSTAMRQQALFLSRVGANAKANACTTSA